MGRHRAVIAWHVPGYAYGGLGFTPLVNLSEVFEEQPIETLEKAIADLDEGRNSVEIEPVVREGRAASVLVEEAKRLTSSLLAHEG